MLSQILLNKLLVCGKETIAYDLSGLKQGVGEWPSDELQR